MTATHDSLVYLRAVLSLIVALGYFAGLIVGIRRLPIPKAVHVSGIMFFIAGAVKNVALAFGVYASNWFLINELFQAASIVIFVGSLVNLVTVIDLHRRQQETKSAEVE